MPEAAPPAEVLPIVRELPVLAVPAMRLLRLAFVVLARLRLLVAVPPMVLSELGPVPFMLEPLATPPLLVMVLLELGPVPVILLPPEPADVVGDVIGTGAPSTVAPAGGETTDLVYAR